MGVPMQQKLVIKIKGDDAFAKEIVAAAQVQPRMKFSRWLVAIAVGHVSAFLRIDLLRPDQLSKHLAELPGDGNAREEAHLPHARLPTQVGVFACVCCAWIVPRALGP